ncbi:MAG: type II toxin-antitoxin system RelE/ParE family toxin [Candidatus Erginobacter occultus]|nr:type II toxin-antitoxin system RelE/ParE family toxin [Candidatus Erginobacter occultus]
MSYKLIIRPAAELELSGAFNWYEERLPGLGAKFLLSVDTVFNAIVQRPQQYPIIHKTIRRALTRRFPYEVLFVADKTRIVVIAVFHAKRNPRRWQNRL